MTEAIWRQNLRDALLLDQLILVHGNVKDLYALEPTAVSQLPETLRSRPFVSFDLWMALEFERLGYPVVVLYDPVDSVIGLRPKMLESFAALAAGKTVEPSAEIAKTESRRSLPKAFQSEESGVAWLTSWDVKQQPTDFFRTLYDRILPQTNTPVAVICRFTDRYLNFTDRQQDQDRLLSLMIQKAGMSIPPKGSQQALQSRVVLVFNTEGEVPQELNVQAPYARSVLIPDPTVEEREDFFKFAAEHFYAGDPGDRFTPDTDPEHLRLVANSAAGLKMHDLLSLVDLSTREQLGLGPKQFKELLDRFRYGTRENAWLKVKPETLRNAKQQLQVRVKGQDEVIKEVIPVLIRAKLGMSDMSGNKYSSKPRGAFFFVGPTGVGKTELSRPLPSLSSAMKSR